MKSHVLFVDDEINFLNGIRRSLHDKRGVWDMSFIDAPLDAWQMLKSRQVDAVVTDVHMPEMTGLELLQRIQTDDQTKSIPVIVLTGAGDEQMKREALEIGATDLLNKPVNREDLLARLRNALRIKSYQNQLEAQNEQLDRKVRERTEELAASRMEIVWRLGKVAEYRDQETGNHIVRVGYYCRAIAETLGMPTEFVETILLAAPLHDLGKIGIPDSILLKPGKLTDDEWHEMRRHCEYGAEILRQDCGLVSSDGPIASLPTAATLSGRRNDVLEMAATIAQCHHEKWDGSGYPRGLVAEEIPIEARIVAVADVYDALRSTRPYKSAMCRDEVLAILEKDSGSHFDPHVQQAFVESLETIVGIETEFAEQQSNATESSHDTCCLR